MQRSHHAEIGGTIETLDFFVAMVAFEEHDRLPGPAPEPPVNPLGFLLNFRHQVPIPCNVNSAGRADLNECEISPVKRVAFQKPLDSTESFWNPLGVVDSIDAQPDT